MNSYMAIDLKSFFASVECLDRNLDIFTTPLVVADKSRGEGTLTLAVTPYLKKQGVKSRSRVFEIPDHIKKTIIFAKPRMSRYIEMSQKVLNVYYDYFSPDDVLVYSVDEVFINLEPYLDLYKMVPYDLAKFIKNEVLKTTGLHSACGVSYNLAMAKICMDIDSKHMENGVAEWTKEDISIRLWPVTPLTKMWGIGPKMEKRFNKEGYYKIGDIANEKLELFEKKFGVMGREIYNHANGIDETLISDRNDYVPKEKSLSNSQTLFEDYYFDESILLILEISDKIARRLRKNNYQGTVVHLSVLYSRTKGGGGFSHQVTLANPTDLSKRIYDACKQIFVEYYELDSPVRKIGISIGKLSHSAIRQFDLFGEVESDEKERKLSKSIDGITDKYGADALLRASSELKKSTVKARNKLIGGHHE